MQRWIILLNSYIEKSMTINFSGRESSLGFYFKYQKEGIKSKKDHGSFFNEPCMMVDISKTREWLCYQSRITLKVKHCALNLYGKYIMERTSFFFKRFLWNISFKVLAVQNANLKCWVKWLTNKVSQQHFSLQHQMPS